MKVELRVTEVEGPSVGTQMRGIRFMEMGFIQDGKVTKKQGNYDGFDTKKKISSSLVDGVYHLDGDQAANGTQPWYDKLTLPGYVGYYAPGTDPIGLPPFPITNVNMSTIDTPEQNGTDPRKFTLTIGDETNMVDTLNIVLDFRLYFAVRTKDAINDSEKVYTQRGQTTWQFDGTGSVNAGGGYMSTGGGNDAVNKYMNEVTDGRICPLTTGPVLSELPQAWSVGDL
jgi:hypothetical protein